jgi:hypothetical protein
MRSWCGAEVAQGQPKAGQTENRNAAVMGWSQTFMVQRLNSGRCS